jgi:hypothetical protein
VIYREGQGRVVMEGHGKVEFRNGSILAERMSVSLRDGTYQLSPHMTVSHPAPAKKPCGGCHEAKPVSHQEAAPVWSWPH